MIGVAVCIEATLTTLAMEPVAAFRFHLFRRLSITGLNPAAATPWGGYAIVRSGSPARRFLPAESHSACR